MRMLLISLLLGFSFVASAQTVPDSSYGTPSQSLPFAPTISHDPDLSVTVCEEIRAMEPCAVEITARGFGSKTLVLAKRLSSGRIVRFARLNVALDGKARFNLKFQEVGIQNILFWLSDSSGGPIAMDGITANVRPPIGTLGEQSDISGSPQAEYSYWSTGDSPPTLPTYEPMESTFDE